MDAISRGKRPLHDGLLHSEIQAAAKRPVRKAFPPGVHPIFPTAGCNSRHTRCSPPHQKKKNTSGCHGRLTSPGKLRSENVISHDRHQLWVLGMQILSSSWTTSLLLFCALPLPPVWALHESEAGVVDWQKTFVGVPRTDVPQVAPSFLRMKGRDDETTSLIVSATDVTLGAVNPVDGSIGECRLRR